MCDRPNSITFTIINKTVKGWINYYLIIKIIIFLDEFGQLLKQRKEDRPVLANPHEYYLRNFLI